MLEVGSGRDKVIARGFSISLVIVFMICYLTFLIIIFINWSLVYFGLFFVHKTQNIFWSSSAAIFFLLHDKVVIEAPHSNKSLLRIFNFIVKKIKGNVQFVQKVTFEPLMYFKQNHDGSWKYYKSWEKLLLLLVFFTKVIKTHSYSFCDRAF